MADFCSSYKALICLPCFTSIVSILFNDDDRHLLGVIGSGPGSSTSGSGSISISKCSSIGVECREAGVSGRLRIKIPPVTEGSMIIEGVACRCDDGWDDDDDDCWVKDCCVEEDCWMERDCWVD